MSLVADDVVCDAPPGLVEDIATFRVFWDDFTGMLTGVTLVAAFGDDDSAVLFYDLEIIPVDSVRVAEYLIVKKRQDHFIAASVRPDALCRLRGGEPGTT